jgi:hypothetical protein
MVQIICDNIHKKLIVLRWPLPLPQLSFSSGSIQAASTARPGNKHNTIIIYVT